MIPKEILEKCVEDNLSLNEISSFLKQNNVKGYSTTNVRHWLKKYNLKTKHLPFNKDANRKAYVDLKCTKCGCAFKKRLKTYNMNLKRNPNHNFYCSRECAGQTPDELSPFRKTLNQAKNRAKAHKRKLNLSIKSLKNLWEKQNGICAISGLEMLKPEYQSHDSKTKNRNPLTGSLDRINSDKGYVDGNIQWVCTFVNYAKNNFDDTQIKNIFKTINI